MTKGGNVTLQCAAEGIPRPAVTWLKDGRPLSGHHRAKILNEGRLLQIRNVKVSDTGRYTCTAVNVAGQADSRHDISVHGMGCVFIIVVVIIIIILHFKLFMSLIPSLASPTNYYRSGRSARECECCCEESNCSELRGLWHPSSCHQLVERWSSSQSFPLSTRPLRWLLSAPVAWHPRDNKPGLMFFSWIELNYKQFNVMKKCLKGSFILVMWPKLIKLFIEWVKEHYEVKCVSWNVEACLNLSDWHYCSVELDQLCVTVTEAKFNNNLWKGKYSEVFLNLH